MRLLLDTHVALWAITDSLSLSAKAREMIADPANTITVSTASIWEISIKRALARGKPGWVPDDRLACILPLFRKHLLPHRPASTLRHPVSSRV
jgi:hypothetical protein